MGAVTVTRDAETPSSVGNKVRTTGVLSLSAAYQPGGDSLDSNLLGLATVERLFLGMPRAAAGAAVSQIIFPVVRSALPTRKGTILIQAFDDNTTESSGDLTGYVIPFEAIGVGG